VLADSSAPSGPNILAQTSDDTTDACFLTAIAALGKNQDLKLSVKFKAISGWVD